MIEKQNILEDIGFSRNESKVYLTVLKLGCCTATEITKESGIHRSNIYDALDSLIKKGCVAYVLKREVKHFEATNPENLKNIIKEKEAKLLGIMPQLLESKMKKQEMSVSVYEGYTNVKKLMNYFVNKREEYFSYGIPMQFPEKLKSWLEWHHKDRIIKKVPIKIIFDEEAKERANVVNNMGLAEAKYFPEGFGASVTTEISGDEILLIFWSENPSIIHIKCREIAEAYKKYFNLLWNIAKSP